MSTTDRIRRTTPDGTTSESAAADDAEPADTSSEPAGPRVGRIRGIRALRRWARPTAAVVAAAVVTAVAFAAGRLSAGSDDELASLRAQLAVDAAAEQAASSYALNVSQVRPGDIEGWRKALQAGVSQQLAPKLSAAVDVVGPWLSQMEYTATAKLLAAKVSRRDGDLFVVQVFVDMNSRSRQTPEGVTATAAYTVTLNRAAAWTITDVGGVTPDLPAPTPAPAPAPR
ncbi:hypothetical protein [Nocardia implantans]|uniref:Mce-associated membrane protein n=1 Tax=Nocardia implantans TaxID=3108168 RepID=A0ABU6AXC6_9NOCA|nr:MULTISPECIES: hypothetical protein [unclassified Nocardia]MBF6193703.1 hypothetical protein [Nocardia beijingensis]MEA3529559.1 hypothetical protein [Nocardia sp. CDC192]MEB3512145.1 hypothetical protein [Nocardia sp. CDC186]